MESIKWYFRNALIGLATMILASFGEKKDITEEGVSDRYYNGDDDFHMFI